MGVAAPATAAEAADMVLTGLRYLAVTAAACEVHHLTHLADGGTTSVDGCALFCFFHHHVAIHQWGWTVALNPDGTTTARNPTAPRSSTATSPTPRPPAPGDHPGGNRAPGLSTRRPLWLV
jgi:hypothetical protein